MTWCALRVDAMTRMRAARRSAPLTFLQFLLINHDQLTNSLMSSRKGEPEIFTVSVRRFRNSQP